MFSLVAMAVGTDEPDPDARAPATDGWTPRRNKKKDAGRQKVDVERTVQGREGDGDDADDDLAAEREVTLDEYGEVEDTENEERW